MFQDNCEKFRKIVLYNKCIELCMKTFKKKIVLLGDGAVGKTSLVRRFVFNAFSDEYIVTIGANFKKKTIEYPKLDIQLDLMIGDLIGQQGFENTQKFNMRGSSGAFIVCDLTRKDTLKSLDRYWIPLLKDVLGSVPPIIFLANKLDLVSPDSEELKFFRKGLIELCEKYDARYYLTSAKTGENVENAFREIGIYALKFEPEMKSMDSIYIVENEISAQKALDIFKVQLYMELGGEEFVNPILQKQISDLKIDVRGNITVEDLKMFVERMREIERSFLPEEEVQKFYIKRMGILSRVH